jgi:hypothetical protein
MAKLEAMAQAICDAATDKLACRIEEAERDIAALEAGGLSLMELIEVHQRSIAGMEWCVECVDLRPDKRRKWERELAEAQDEQRWLLEQVEGFNGTAA